ncbi:hypothetical protein DDW44_01875 [Streptomyces tirandamycinicus]|uniref:Uncharacterized protein n=1 Tax=Streptomyces tirandamycinicus TaxID=2174846 RepID=A0A2S1SMS0_9ACTN|nr:hypothetical protein DDW44_01875 [Streptomyces tirandamycinicus]
MPEVGAEARRVVAGATVGVLGRTPATGPAGRALEGRAADRDDAGRRVRAAGPGGGPLPVRPARAARKVPFGP